MVLVKDPDFVMRGRKDRPDPATRPRKLKENGMEHSKMYA